MIMQSYIFFSCGYQKIKKLLTEKRYEIVNNADKKKEKTLKNFSLFFSRFFSSCRAKRSEVETSISKEIPRLRSE
jgi:hypothetical protein